MLIESFGSYDLIVPHRCSVPSCPISTILPPCFGSIRNDLAGLPLIIDTERLCSGHQLPISFTNTWNAVAWVQGTSIVLTMGSSIMLSCRLGLRALFAARTLGTSTSTSLRRLECSLLTGSFWQV